MLENCKLKEIHKNQQANKKVKHLHFKIGLKTLNVLIHKHQKKTTTHKRINKQPNELLELHDISLVCCLQCNTIISLYNYMYILMIIMILFLC